MSCLLLGMGIRTLSMTPPMIPEIKQVIRSVTIEDCNHLTRTVLAMNSERQISSYLRAPPERSCRKRFEWMRDRE